MVAYKAVRCVVHGNSVIPEEQAYITRLYREDRHNLDLMRRTVEVEALPEMWREYFMERLT